MRLDRLFTLRFVKPWGDLLELFHGNPEGPALPILMYHSISADAEPNAAPYYRVCTSTQQFAAHLAWIRRLGFRGVSLAEGITHLQTAVASAERAERLVAITFDDGFQNFYTEAFPALQKEGFSATMYLPTAFIGDSRRSIGRRTCLTWQEVRELDAAGIEFGSHTVNHPRLADLPWPQVHAELLDSKRTIEDELRHEVQGFAFPYAYPQADRDFALRFRDLLSALQYRTAVTTSLGRATASSDCLELPRVPANSADDEQLFGAKLSGHYDWLGSAQGLHKSLRRLLRRDSKEPRFHPRVAP